MEALPIQYTSQGGGLVFTGVDRLDLAASCACGQCFRWTEQPDGSYLGIVRGIPARVSDQDGALLLSSDEQQFSQLWRDYFDCDTDYAAICDSFAVDAFTAAAASVGLVDSKLMVSRSVSRLLSTLIFPNAPAGLALEAMGNMSQSGYFFIISQAKVRVGLLLISSIWLLSVVFPIPGAVKAKRSVPPLRSSISTRDVAEYILSCRAV